MKQTLKYIYDKLQEQLKYAETKHSISITLASALTVFTATYLESSTPLINALSAISIIFSIVSVLYSFIALSSKKIHFKKNGFSNHHKLVNLVYFKDISSFSPEDYLNHLSSSYPIFKKYKADNFDLDLSKLVVATSKTIYSKLLLFNFALSFLILSLFCECAVIILKGI